MQYILRFSERGGTLRKISARRDMVQILRGYIEATRITEGPLFPTTY